MNQDPDSPRVLRVYRPNELPELLGVTPAMVRRYSDAFETVTGNTITRDRRARIYSEQQVNTLKDARALVDASEGAITIEQAIRRVLGIDIVIEPRSSAIQSTESSPLSQLLERLTTITDQNAKLFEHQSLMLESQNLVQEQNTQLLAHQTKLEDHNAKLLERLDSLEGQNQSLQQQLTEVKANTEKATLEKPKGWLAKILGR